MPGTAQASLQNPPPPQLRQCHKFERATQPASVMTCCNDRMSTRTFYHKYVRWLLFYVKSTRNWHNHGEFILLLENYGPFLIISCTSMSFQKCWRGHHKLENTFQINRSVYRETYSKVFAFNFHPVYLICMCCGWVRVSFLFVFELFGSVRIPIGVLTEAPSKWFARTHAQIK